MEGKLQKTIIRDLKDLGFYVIKTRPGMGTPVGCPDVIGLKGPGHVEIEVKASEKSPFRVGQQATLQYLKRGNKFVYVAYPENWPLIKAEIVAHFS